MNLGQRIKEARLAAGFETQEALTEALGWKMPSGRIGNYEQGKREPKFLVLQQIAVATRVRLQWLMTGEGEMCDPSPRTGDPDPEADAEAFERGMRDQEEARDATRRIHSLPTGASTDISTAGARGEIPAGYVRFPLLDGFVAAGDGGYVADHPEVVQEITVAEDWVRRNISAPQARVRVITAQGDSMTPEINSGDVLFVDSGVTWFDSDAVYVLNWRGRPLVKRLQLRRDGTLLIKSVNPAYDAEPVPPGEIDSLHISGRVAGVWQFRKY